MLKRIALSLVVLFPVAAMAAGEDQWLQPRIETGLKYGSKRSIGGAELWIPVSQDYDRVLYADFRLTLDDQDNREVNAGLGYRRIVRLFDHDVILGGHGWLDRRITRYDSTLHQVTLGGEAYTRDWDFRINAYAPLNDESIHVTPTVGSSTPYLAGTGIYYNTTGLLLEEAQPGGDIEIGRRIPIFEDYAEAIRLYAGGFHFEGDQTENVSGWRVRLVADVTPDFSIGGRFQRDDERGTQGFLEATLRFPFASKQSFRKEGLRARLDESPERDIDIVTGGRVLDTGVAKPVLSSETGTQQRVLHVDNTADAGGDGTQENPFNTLKAAEAQLASHDVLYIHAGDGTTSGQDEGLMITLPNITVIGSGVDFVFDGSNFTTGTGSNLSGTLIAAAITAPVMTNLEDQAGDNLLGVGILVSADGAKISGLSFDNTTGGHSIYAYNNTGTVWESVEVGNIYSTYATGVRGETVRIQSNAENSVINNVYVHDIEVHREKGMDRNINITASRGVINNLRIADVTAYGGNQNLGITAQGGGFISNTLVENSNFYEGNNGIQITAQSYDAAYAQQGFGEVTLRNVTSQNNNLNITFGANNVPMQKVTLINVDASNNDAASGTYGLNLSTNSNGYYGEIVIDGLTATGNRQSGLRIASSHTAAIGSVQVQNSTFTGNGQFGIVISDGSSTSLDLDFGGGNWGSVGQNSIYGNGLSNPATYGDLQLDLDGSLTPMAAQYNWWGQSGGPITGQVKSYGSGSPPSADTGTADTSSALDGDPNL